MISTKPNTAACNLSDDIARREQREIVSFGSGTAETVGEPEATETAVVVRPLVTAVQRLLDLFRRPPEISNIAFSHLSCRVLAFAGDERPIASESNHVEFVVTMPPVADSLVRLRDQRREGVFMDDFEHRPQVFRERRLNEFLLGRVAELHELSGSLWGRGLLVSFQQQLEVTVGKHL